MDRIGKSISGEVRLELTHFPIDSSFASVVAKEVDAAVGAGFVLPTGLSGITCDVNSSADTSVPADTSLDPGDWNIPADGSFDVDVIELDPTDLDDMPQSSIDGLAVGGIGGLGGGGGGGGGGGDASEGNPQDPLNPQDDPPGPYDDWPVWYPTPGSTEWPESFPTETAPGNGDWIEPIFPTTPNQPWSIFPPSFKTVIGHGGGVRGCMFVSTSCVPSGVFVAPVSFTLTTPSLSANQHPKSAFALYTAGTGCGGWGGWQLVYIDYNGDIGYLAGAAGCDSNNWVAEPVVEFYWQET